MTETLKRPDECADDDVEWRVVCQDDETGIVSLLRLLVSARRRADGTFRARTTDGGVAEAFGPWPRRAVLNLAREAGWPIVSIHDPYSTDPTTATLRDCIAAAQDVARRWDDRADSVAYVDHTSDECRLIADGAREVIDALRGFGLMPDDGGDDSNA